MAALRDENVRRMIVGSVSTVFLLLYTGCLCHPVRVSQGGGVLRNTTSMKSIITKVEKSSAVETPKSTITKAGKSPAVETPKSIITKAKKAPVGGNPEKHHHQSCGNPEKHYHQS